jgi:antitoxin HicB
VNSVPAFEKYPFDIALLPEGEGGDFAITFPDLPGCLSDGETVEQTIAHGREAFQSWMESMIEDCKPIPRPYGSPWIQASSG